MTDILGVTPGSLFSCPVASRSHIVLHLSPWLSHTYPSSYATPSAVTQTLTQPLPSINTRGDRASPLSLVTLSPPEKVKSPAVIIEEHEKGIRIVFDINSYHDYYHNNHLDIDNM